MKYRNILVTGGAGFVGSNICLKLMDSYQGLKVTALDNLIRKGSELNVSRLENGGVEFIQADIRDKDAFAHLKETDLVIECSAEPSVLAGVNGSPEYVIETNLFGAVNCFEFARRRGAHIVFLSTSRIYPQDRINLLNYTESKTRFEPAPSQSETGVSRQGITEEFNLQGIRSMYGATKLGAELLLAEYAQMYGVKSVMDRFGVIAGPWQMGKVDQGIITFWLAAHIYNTGLSYFGFGGKGKQVRDIIHIDDVYDLIIRQLDDIDKYESKSWNAGGGLENSISLCELTQKCQLLTQQKIVINEVPETRANDMIWYVTDSSKLINKSGWNVKKNIDDILLDTFNWITDHKRELTAVFGT